MQLIFPLSENAYNLRQDTEFRANRIKTVYHGTDTIRFQGPKVWSCVPNDIKNANNFIEFKS